MDEPDDDPLDDETPEAREAVAVRAARDWPQATLSSLQQLISHRLHSHWLRSRQLQRSILELRRAPALALASDDALAAAGLSSGEELTDTNSPSGGDANSRSTDGNSADTDGNSPSTDEQSPSGADRNSNSGGGGGANHRSGGGDANSHGGGGDANSHDGGGDANSAAAPKHQRMLAFRAAVVVGPSEVRTSTGIHTLPPTGIAFHPTSMHSPPPGLTSCPPPGFTPRPPHRYSPPQTTPPLVLR